MKTKVFSVFLLLVLLAGVMTPAPQRVQAKAPDSATTDTKSSSPDGMINSDGTLNLDGTFSGSLDLSGYDIQMDPARGPIFHTKGDKLESPQAAAPATGQWTNLGYSLSALEDSVKAIAVSGSDVYLGGFFTNANGIGAADYVVKWDGANWSALGSNGANDGVLDRDVNALAVSGTDIYVGGDFTSVNNNGVVLSAARYLARWDGSNWHAVGDNGAGGPSLNSWVMTIKVDGNNVYVGGDFRDVTSNGSTLYAADYVARWNKSTGQWYALGGDASGNGALNDLVYDLEVDASGNLYAGGNFTNAYSGNAAIGAINASDYIVKWDGSYWLPLGGQGGWGGNGSLNDAVYSIAISDTTVYTGGIFTDVNNYGTILNEADYVAQYDTVSNNWSAMSNGGAGVGSINGTVFDLAVDGSGNLYVGGDFTDVKNGASTLTAADKIVKWDGSHWSALGGDGFGNGSLNIAVQALAINGSKVYVGGGFSQINNNETLLPGRYIAVWGGVNWSALPGTFHDGSITRDAFGGMSYVNSIAVIGSDVYVGGAFVNVANGATELNAADYVVKWDGTKWSALGNNGAGNGALNGPVHALAASGTNLYVGGLFTNAAGIAEADSIAKWNTVTETWSALGDDGAGGGALLGSVMTIAVNGSDVYAGGAFNVQNNPEAGAIAKWNAATETWSALGNNGAGVRALNNQVVAIAIHGSDVYVGGSFTDAAGIPTADRIAKWNGTNWSALGDNGAGDGAIGGTVMTIAISGSNVYIGGDFLDVANIQEADYIAKWDGAQWSALGNDGASNGALNYVVMTLAVNGPNLYVGGRFSTAHNGTTVLNTGNIAMWNGAKWSALSTDGAGGSSLGGGVFTIVTHLSTLYAGGGFRDINNNGAILYEADNIAAYGLPPVASTFKSTGAQDGWILAKTPANTAGGSMNATSTTLRLGDDAAKKQYRNTLSFATQILPDNAVITNVTLKIKKQAIVGGGEPVTMFGGFMVDVKKGTFGTASLQLTDFGATANKTVGPFKPTLTGDWYSINLTAAKLFVNKMTTGSGLTQIRLRFKTSTNNNAIANYLNLFSGNAATASRPQLIVEYYVP